MVLPLLHSSPPQNNVHDDFRKGVAYFLTNQHEKALACFQEVAQKFSYAPARLCVGFINQEDQDLIDGITQIPANPSADIHYDLSLYYFLRQQYQDAEDHLLQASKQGPVKDPNLLKLYRHFAVGDKQAKEIIDKVGLRKDAKPLSEKTEHYVSGVIEIKTSSNNSAPENKQQTLPASSSSSNAHNIPLPTATKFSSSSQTPKVKLDVKKQREDKAREKAEKAQARQKQVAETKKSNPQLKRESK